MGSSSVIAGREEGTIVGLEGMMKSLEVDATFQPEGPNVNLAVNLEGLTIRGKHPVLCLRSLSVESGVSSHSISQNLRSPNP